MIAWLLALSLAAAAPRAADLDERVLVDALVDELEREAESLSLADAPDLYHLRYELVLADQLSVSAEAGGLVGRSASPWSSLEVEVRVGTPELDNTGLGGWRNGFRSISLPDLPTPVALQRAAWRGTDAAFKDAVEQYGRKVAQVVRPDDHPGDYVLTGPVLADDGRADPRPEGLTERVVQLSLALAAVPGLERARVDLGHEAGARWIVDTEGTRVRVPVHETTIRVSLHAVADDGERLTDHRLWTVRSPDDLPDDDTLAAESVAAARALVARAEAPAFEGEYVGPVLLEGQAAAELFRWLLLPQLQGTPPDKPFDSWLGEIGREDDVARIGRRVLPEGWRVVDDPTADPAFPGGWRHDAEGTATIAVVAVDDGVVRQPLTTRTPLKEGLPITGHGRGSSWNRATARAAHTTVTPRRGLSSRRLLRAALKAAARYGLDHVLVVRRLQAPQVVALGDPEARFAEPEPLPRPVEVIRRYADGREEIVRGVRFHAVDRWVLRDLAAAGPSGAHDHLSAWDRRSVASLDPTEGVPVRVIAPDVLVGELELTAAPRDPADVHSLPSPSYGPPVGPGPTPEEE